jgi:hypothetical protein
VVHVLGEALHTVLILTDTLNTHGICDIRDANDAGLPGLVGKTLDPIADELARITSYAGYTRSVRVTDNRITHHNPLENLAVVRYFRWPTRFHVPA